MGEFAYSAAGGSIVPSLRLKLGATTAVGAPVIDNAAGGAGVGQASTTSWANAVGLTLDAGTYSTTQGDAEGAARVIISPMAVYKWRIAGSATASAQAQIVTNSSASTTGATITITSGDQDPSSPTMDEGTAYCISGANAGQSRKITSVTSTTAVVTVPFTNDLAVGDVFMLVPWTPFDVAGNNLQFTSDLLEANQTIAVGTGAAVRIVALSINPHAARTDSYVLGTADDHVLNATT